jgi:hypothetical protein
VQPRKAAGRANPRQRRHRRPPDDYDVWQWFARAPQACVADSSARRILRGLKHPFRPWFRFPTLDEIKSARKAEERKRLQKERDDLIDQQHVPWWQHLRAELLRVGVPALSADSFTDYLSGYVMVRDRDQAKSEKERINLVLSDRGYVLESSGEQKKGRVTAEWRRAKRLARALRFPPSPTTHPPHSQSLKTTLTHLMVEALKSDGASLAMAADTVNSVWGLIGEASNEFDLGFSVARAARRARQRKKLGQ